MGIRAIAFHEVIAMEKIRERFGAPESQRQIEMQQGKCVKCNLAFAIVLLVKFDRKNPEYIGHLNSIIADDCTGGHHKDEYVLDEIDPPFSVN
jgi:hypothetical protein